MTRIREMSDIHLEFGPMALRPIGEDVLVLAGDIGLYDEGGMWARDYARRTGIPIVMIAGNHEFYRGRVHQDHTYASTLRALREAAAEEPLLHFLEDEAVTVAGVTFLGATLWTDFALNGDAILAAWRASQAMNDFHKIWVTETERLTPEDVAAKHSISREFLVERLKVPTPGPVVVMTHHLPSRRSIAGRYANSDYNAAYASALDGLVERSSAAVWFHGHTHVSQDYRIGQTRVICNPRGYAGYESNPRFNPDLVVEI